MAAPQQQKLKISGPVVVTANRVGDGAIVYRAGQGWTTDLAAAAVVTTSQEAGALLGDAAADDLNAVGAYVAPVRLGDHGEVAPGNLRERIRRFGPTIVLPTPFGV